MRVLYISKYAATASSGYPSRQYFYSKHLAELGNTVLLIYSNSNGRPNNGQNLCSIQEELNGRLLIKLLRGPKINLGLNLKRIWSWIYFEYQLYKFYGNIRDFRPDIIIVSSLSLLTFVNGVLFKKRLGIPLVLEVRDLYPLTITDLGRFTEKNPFIKVLSEIEKYGYRHADLIISTLENSKEYFELRKGGPVRFKWLPMGFDPNLYALSPDKISMGLIESVLKLKTKGYFIICYSGSIGYGDALSEVLDLSLDRNIIDNKIYFVFIGSGPMLEGYKTKYFAGNVLFLNPIEKKYLPLLLKQCDLLINTWYFKKIYQNGISPNKWIEYMYSGRPILLSFGYNSRIFNEADCGWQLFACNNIILKAEILKIRNFSKEILNVKGAKGKDYLVSQLNYVKLAKELEASLKDCIIFYDTNQ